MSAPGKLQKLVFGKRLITQITEAVISVTTATLLLPANPRRIRIDLDYARSGQPVAWYGFDNALVVNGGAVIDGSNTQFVDWEDHGDAVCLPVYATAQAGGPALVYVRETILVGVADDD